MTKNNQRHPFLDFFAGSGLVCEGLKNFFKPVWANDICEKKAAVFCANHPKKIFRLDPIEIIKGKDLPEAFLSWGSFPCQDLSLAGKMGGISSARSGLVWHWLRVMDEMNHKPSLIVAENVIGLISADNGSHYRQLHKALFDRGYKVGPLILDASYWVPQSRKRVFIVAVKKEIPTKQFESELLAWCHPISVQRAAKGLPGLVWWSLPEPKEPKMLIEDIIELDAPCDDNGKRDRLLELIPAKHQEIMRAYHEAGRFVFPGYKRIRNGKQVLELRFDGLAGCLRTPEGGSSRQFVLIIHNGSIKSRILTARETAALMGVRKSYKIPGSYNDVYKAMGDAVAVPVTRYLARHLLEPISNIIMEKKNEN